MRTSISKRVQNYQARVTCPEFASLTGQVRDARTGFAEESNRQSRLLRSDPEEPEISAWLA